MIELNIPGRGLLRLNYLVCDVNGTLALDGILPEGLAKIINNLRDRLEIHLITADTRGRQAAIDEQLNLVSVRISPGSEANQKAAYIRSLGKNQVVAIGQGANDAQMLKEAALGICLLSREGLATQSLLAADLIVPDIFAALDLLYNPMRIVASLRE